MALRPARLICLNTMLMALLTLWCGSAAAKTDEVFLRAAQSGDRAAIERLIANGSDVNERTDGGWSALMLASYYGRDEAVRVLIEKGADVNASSDDGGTALLAASLNGHADIVKALVGKGADVNAATKTGTTSLM